MFNDYGYSEEGRLGSPYDVRLLKRLLPFVKPYGGRMSAAVLLSILITFAEIAVPYITKMAIDRYIVPKADSRENTAYLNVPATSEKGMAIVSKYPDRFQRHGDHAQIALEDLSDFSADEIRVLRRDHLTGILKLTLLFLVIILLDFGFNFSQVLVLESTGQRIMHDLRLRLYTHVQSLDLAYFNRTPVARLVTRTTNDIQNMHELFTAIIVVVFKDLFLVTGIIAMMLALNWRLALICLSVMPLAVWASHYFSGLTRDVFRVIRVKTAEINARFAETIGGMKIIQLFHQEAANYEKFKRLNHEFYEAGMRQIHIFASFMPLIEVFSAVSLALVIIFGGNGVLEGTLSLGVLVAFISYMRMFFRPIRELAEKYNILQNAMSSAERIFQILDTREHLPTAEIPLERERFRSLSFDNVSFEYVTGEPVLKGVSFSLAAGETLAVVGPTGAGKTSVINLIMRFYDPQGGGVFFNGKNLKEWDIGSLRTRMALVTQDPFLFSDTIRANITLGNHRLGDDALAPILDAANCRWVTDRLPDGLDTRLVEGGAFLSSGERQLISIARAMAVDPDLILLDEATSYIDSETEARIQEALVRLLKHRTAIIVAHRLSTTRNADRIAVIRGGRIAEIGSHAELMSRPDGFYFKLHQYQRGQSGRSIE